MTIKILLTGGGGAGNEALYSLLEGRYTLYFGDADVSTINPIIPKDRRYKLPLASDPNFCVNVCEICRHLNIDLLIPGVDEELLKFAENVDLFMPTKLLMPDKDYIKIMLDKFSMINSLSAKNIPVPFSRILTDDLTEINFPCISKPRVGRGSKNVKIINSFDEAEALKLKEGSFANQILIQNKINGTEYTVQMFADNQTRLCSIVPVKVDIKKGITLSAETESEPRVIKACKAIHQAIPTKGCYNIQLILNKKGQVLPFEINPRVSTTLCLSVAAGIDPIAIFFGAMKYEKMPQFISGIRLRRHWSNYFFYENTVINQEVVK